MKHGSGVSTAPEIDAWCLPPEEVVRNLSGVLLDSANTAGGGRKAASATRDGKSFGLRNSQMPAHQSGWKNTGKMRVSRVPQTMRVGALGGHAVSLPTLPRRLKPSSLLRTLTSLVPGPSCLPAFLSQGSGKEASFQSSPKGRGTSRSFVTVPLLLHPSVTESLMMQQVPAMGLSQCLALRTPG